MIRATCAWVLVVLATSPVTAPFSTCDLRELLAPTAAVHAMSLVPTAAMAAPLLIDSDANSISPIVPRHELPGADSSRPVMLLFRSVTSTARELLRSHEIELSPHNRTARPTVLRL